MSACPFEAIGKLEGSPYPHFDRSRCEACDDFSCADVCLGEALVVSGRMMGVGEIMKILNRDRFYWGSRGGVTFGGGEPFGQPSPLLQLLTACRDTYIHTAVETSGAARPADFSAALPFIDWLFFDIKHLESKAHRKGTGLGNELIQENLKALCQSTWPGRLLIRFTVVPGFNDDWDHLVKLALFLCNLGITDIEIQPLHHLGASKYTQLGQTDAASALLVPSPARMLEIAGIFRAHSLNCFEGGEAMGSLSL